MQTVLLTYKVRSTIAASDHEAFFDRHENKQPVIPINYVWLMTSTGRLSRLALLRARGAIIRETDSTEHRWRSCNVHVTL